MDIQKERELFLAHMRSIGSASFMFELDDDGNFDDMSMAYAWSAWQAAKAESHKSASLYQWEINHLAAANQQWRDYAAKAQAVPKWISVEDELPPCDFEFCETGEHVSNVVLIHSAATYGFNMGMGHVNEDGVWNVYSGEHDFMNVLEVTHWMPLPDAPQEPAND